MLSKMFYEGADYDEVLKEAQDNGYAERNRKRTWKDMTHAARLRFFLPLSPDSRLTLRIFIQKVLQKLRKKICSYAKKMDMAIKLIASSKRHDDHVHAIVAPMLF